MQVNQSATSRLIMQIVLTLPWLFLAWLVARAINGTFDGWLAFVLVIILAPIAVVLNTVTVVAFRGREVLKQFQAIQNRESIKKEPLQSTNYSDLPWWDPRKYLSR